MNELKRRRPTEDEEEETDSREGKDELTQEEVGPSLKGIFTLFVVTAIRNPKPKQNNDVVSEDALYAAMSVP